MGRLRLALCLLASLRKRLVAQASSYSEQMSTPSAPGGVAFADALASFDLGERPRDRHT